jgi:hypothetical protein
MRRLVLAVLLVPSLASAQGLGEVFEGLTNPQLVVAGTYRSDAPEGTSKYGALLTANVLGPKMGTVPCYLGGVGVDVRTTTPGLENAPFAGWSVPLVTCAPWGEQVVLQAGISSDFANAPELGDDQRYYFGIGISAVSPNTLKAKRIKRIEAKAKRRADASQGPPSPAAQ